jgi:hypothetical protein
VDQWLQRLNPEAVVILFGSNDVGQMGVEEYERKTREVVRRCLTNGAVVILTAMPPRSNRLDESWQFVEAARTMAREERVSPASASTTSFSGDCFHLRRPRRFSSGLLERF